MRCSKKKFKFKFNLKSPVLSLLLLLFLFNSAFAGAVFKGMNTHSNLSEKDLIDFRHFGGQVLRIGFALDPLINKKPPYEVNYEAFNRLDDIIAWSKNLGLKIIIDPHTAPGTKKSTSTSVDDAFWNSADLQNKLIYLWGVISERYAHESDVIYGYDLLNEPAAFSTTEGALDNWNVLVRKLVTVIRSHDKYHSIIIEPPSGRDKYGSWVTSMKGFLYIDPIIDNNVIYSPHIYAPGVFTHQGIDGRKKNINYPGFINGVYWDKTELSTKLRPILEFQKKYSARIFVGEFSASLFSGPDGIRYIKDLVDLFDEYGWGWAYHAYRQSPVWDAEKDKEKIVGEDGRGYTRIDVLKEAFCRNRPCDK